ncbi:MAG: hypothetical protein M1826_001317 [Phylliscum demangeonii]|nr:MAG: hypothetical protein M1826_001317 [Phylliscum demangeonii]
MSPAPPPALPAPPPPPHASLPTAPAAAPPPPPPHASPPTAPATTTATTTATTATTTPPAAAAAAPPPPPPRALPPSISILRATTRAHTHALQQLNTAHLPIAYRPAFYDNILTSPEIGSVTRLAVHRRRRSSTTAGSGRDDEVVVVVGGIRCLIEPGPAVDDPAVPRIQVYIQSLVVQAAYREMGVGAALVEAVERGALGFYAGGVEGVGEVEVQLSAHVWERNEEALEWYRRRGFVVGDELVDAGWCEEGGEG